MGRIIDLGTTNHVAILDGEAPRVIENAEGDRTILLSLHTATMKHW